MQRIRPTNYVLPDLKIKVWKTNPSSTFIVLAEIKTGDKIKIFDSIGDDVKFLDYNNNNELNISSFSNGIYFVFVNNKYYSKFIKYD